MNEQYFIGGKAGNILFNKLHKLCHSFQRILGKWLKICKKMGQCPLEYIQHMMIQTQIELWEKQYFLIRRPVEFKFVGLVTKFFLPVPLCFSTQNSIKIGSFFD